MAAFSDRLFVVFVLISQILFLILFAALGKYEKETALPFDKTDPTADPNDSQNAVDKYYSMFQDVHVMIYIGFGFLMTFLKKYGYSAVSINLLLAAYAVQWHILVIGFFHMKDGKFDVGLTDLILSEFCAGAVLISMGAILGKVSPIQYAVMVFFEVIFFSINEWVFEQLSVNDVGGSMNLHMFGAYFGLVIAFIHQNEAQRNSPNEGSVYHSDIFSLIGTVFLWLFWPSFNAALVDPADARNRALINTYFSLAACTLVAFALSALLNKNNKFEMVHIQNSTLAGGVAIGSAANLMVTPFGAMVVGSLAGAVSVLGYKYLQSMLKDKINLHDTCGVNNLHGLPGIMGGVVSIILAAMASQSDYGDTLYTVFPAMGPLNSTTHQFPSQPRTPGTQAAYQLAGLGCAFGICIVGGVITGFIMKLLYCHKITNDHELFNDDQYFEVHDEEQKSPQHDIPHGIQMKSMA